MYVARLLYTSCVMLYAGGRPQWDTPEELGGASGLIIPWDG